MIGIQAAERGAVFRFFHERGFLPTQIHDDPPPSEISGQIVNIARLESQGGREQTGRSELALPRFAPQCAKKKQTTAGSLPGAITSTVASGDLTISSFRPLPVAVASTTVLRLIVAGRAVALRRS